MKDMERALAELMRMGLVTRNAMDAGVTYSFDSAVAQEITQWMQAHPDEKEGLNDELVMGELGHWYAASFDRLADSASSEAVEQASEEARAVLQCFLQAQDFGELGTFASRIITGTRDPELLAQVIDDFTASGVDVVFADYCVRGLLGAGATSAVFEAERADNALPVAIKVLRGRWSDEETDVLRFLDEAKIANRVRHPNVVEVFAAGHTDRTRFITMELLRGRSLERRWRAKGRRLPLKRVLEISMHVLGVLAAAHEKSILHGGIRPSNIFITGDGSVKVLDFGLESLTRTAPRAPRLPDAPVPPSFLAPEQVRGELPDPRTDLWSVGSTMLALLSGRSADIERVEPLSALLPGVPRAIVDIIERALRPAREERWSSAQEMWEAIAEIHRGMADPEEHYSDPGPANAPLVETDPAGPLSERIALDTDEDSKRFPSSRAPMKPHADVLTSMPAAAPASIRPQSTSTSSSARSAPVLLKGAVSGTFLFLTAIALMAAAIAVTLLWSAPAERPQPPPPSPSSGAAAQTGLPTSPSLSGMPPQLPPSPSDGGAATPPTAPLGVTGDKRNGDKCESSPECKSGECVDGVCCSSACAGKCVACNLPSFLGMCAEIPYGQDPDKECTPKVCDGDGSCGERKINGKRCKASRECKSGFCVRGVCCATECRGLDGNCSSGTCLRSLLIE